MRAMDKNFTKPKKIMEVNLEHPLIRNLSRMYIADTTNPILRKCVTHLYEGGAFGRGRPAHNR